MNTSLRAESYGESNVVSVVSRQRENRMNTSLRAESYGESNVV